MPSLKKKVESLLLEYNTALEEKNSATGDLDKHYKEVKSNDVVDKLKKLYLDVMSKIPQDKHAEFYPRIMEKFLEVSDQATYDRYVKHGNPSVLNTQHRKDHCLIYFMPGPFVRNGLYESLLNIAEQYVPQQELKVVLDEIDKYVYPSLNNIPIKYFDEKVSEAKEKAEREIDDPERKRELQEELDAINDTVIVSSEKYSRVNGDDIDVIYETEKNNRIDRNTDDAFNSEEYGKYAKYFKVNKSGAYSGVREVNPEHIGDLDFPKQMLNDDVKIIIPEKVKNVLVKVVNLMKKKEIILPDDRGGEEGSKAYSFKKVGEAIMRLDDAIASGDVNEMREARGEYLNRVEDMREIFKIVEDELSPTPDMCVGNVNSYRAEWVPGEFKNNLVVNSVANSIYNLACILRDVGYSIEELLENPNQVIMNIFRDHARQLSMNNLLKGEKVSSAVVKALSATTRRDYPDYKLGRIVEMLVQFSRISENEANFYRNDLTGTLLQSFNTYMSVLNLNNQTSTLVGYLSGDADITISNMMLTNDSDRNYDNLRSFEALSTDGLEKIPPFDSAAYLETHEIDPADLLKRIQDTVKDVFSEKGISPQNRAVIIRAAQRAAYQYTQLRAMPENEGKKEYKELLKLVESPNKMFSKELQGAVKEKFLKLPDMKTYVKSIATQGKSFTKQCAEQAREAENSYNLNAANIEKEIKTLEEQIGVAGLANNGEEVNRLSKMLTDKIKEFDAARKTELERLEKDFADGKMPKDYFDNRYADVMGNNYGEKRPFGLSEYPTRRQFEKKYSAELKNGELTKSDVKMLYDQMMEIAEREQNKFNLVAAKVHKPQSLESSSFKRIEREIPDAPAHDEAEVKINPVGDELEEERVNISIEEIGQEKIYDKTVKAVGTSSSVTKDPFVKE